MVATTMPPPMENSGGQVAAQGPAQPPGLGRMLPMPAAFTPHDYAWLCDEVRPTPCAPECFPHLPGPCPCLPAAVDAAIQRMRRPRMRTVTTNMLGWQHTRVCLQWCMWVLIWRGSPPGGRGTRTMRCAGVLLERSAQAEALAAPRSATRAPPCDILPLTPLGEFTSGRLPEPGHALKLPAMLHCVNLGFRFWVSRPEERCCVQVASERTAGDAPWPASSPDEPSDSGGAGPTPLPPHRSPTPGAPPCSEMQVHCCRGSLRMDRCQHTAGVLCARSNAVSVMGEGRVTLAWVLCFAVLPQLMQLGRLMPE